MRAGSPAQVPGVSTNLGPAAEQMPVGSREAQGGRGRGRNAIPLAPSFLITGVTYTHVTHTLAFLSPAEPGSKQDNEEA